MGTRKLATILSIAVLIVFLIWSAALAQTEKAKVADTLTGDKVIARFVEAAGGTDAHAKLTSRYQHASIELMANLTVPITTYQVRPNKMKTIMTSDQIGTIERGYDGTLFWEKGTMTGARLIEGQELIDAIREEAAFDKISAWKDLYSKAEYIGTDSAAGTMCRKVRVYPKGSSEQVWFLDLTSGLPLKITMTMNTQMGAVPADIMISDYRKVDGVMMPFKIATSAAGMNMVVVVDSVANNIAIPDSVFAPPADVLELTKQKE